MVSLGATSDTGAVSVPLSCSGLNRCSRMPSAIQRCEAINYYLTTTPARPTPRHIGALEANVSEASASSDKAYGIQQQAGPDVP
eukprot:scaffold72961_cov18-Prasinocladus_malaysianus.AAC.1